MSKRSRKSGAPEIVIVDTTVMLNFLDVPNHNNKRDLIDEQFEALVDRGARFILPLATVFQTGDHIADLPDRNNRFRYASALRDQIRKAENKESPWDSLHHLESEKEIEGWLNRFPNFTRNGSVRGGKGYNVSILSMIEAQKTARKRIPGGRIRMWSLNARLQNQMYDPIL